MKKTVLFILNREVSYLPPFMAILDSLCNLFSLKVISYEKKGGIESLEKIYKDKDVEFLCHLTQDDSTSFKSRVVRRIRKSASLKTPFQKEAEDLMNHIAYDLLWVIHEETAFDFRKFLFGKKYIVSLYELNDYRRDFLEKIETVLQNATEVMIPEYNRACILRVWLKLKETPTVVPNKPYLHPRNKYIENSYSTILKDKKVILYQGYIQRNRNLNAICEAGCSLNDYKVVLMGKGDESYIDELKRKYPEVYHIPFVQPPEHLKITSFAHLAVVKYDMVSLNMIFCAPNKTWEYTGFGVPVLCNEIPGLEYTIGKFGAGICTDLNDANKIITAIDTIDRNYEEYSKNATAFYDSYDIESELKRIVSRNID